MVNPPPLGLYIHFPWCVRKCPYCDFNSHEVKGGAPEQRYIAALREDFEHEFARLDSARAITSIFMGGGTPSLFAPEPIAALLQTIRAQAPVAADCEITLEANPGAIDSVKFREFRSLGINRLSIGVQSFNSEHLRLLGRIHDAGQAVDAAQKARAAGFDNFNLDLMFGLPGQTPDQTRADVQIAIDLEPTHLSYYHLTLEPNTYFHKYPPPLPEADAAYRLQLAGQHILAQAGYRQYEISAYAQEGYSCRHNRNYWQFGDYIGIGAGAHGKLSLSQGMIRTAKPKHPEHYMQNPAHAQVESVAAAQLPFEFLMNHLRLRDGFSLLDYRQRTGLDASSLEPALSQCQAQGLLRRSEGRIACTEKGWDFLDDVLGKFLPD